MTTHVPPPPDWSRLTSEPDLLLPLPVPADEPPLAMAFRRIPAGWFMMGSRDGEVSEEPRHRVEMPHEFWLGKFAVTQAEWSAVTRALPLPKEIRADPSYFKGSRRPVEGVNWNDATEWCSALAAWPGLPRGIGEVRLPTEAEWEYACRAGTETDYYSGDGEAALAQVGWYFGNAGGATHIVDEAVGGKAESHPAGLVGMHGNVWEWCHDVWDAKAYSKRVDELRVGEWSREGAGDDATHYYAEIKSDRAPDRVLRGGSWDISARGCGSASRGRCGTNGLAGYFGFRLCLVPGPGAQLGRGAPAS